MQSAAKPCRLKRATRSATVVPLCRPASWAAWMNTPVRATASNALARRTTSTRSLFLLTIRSKSVRSLGLSFRSGSRCGVGILAPSGQVSGKDSSSGHLGHDPLVVFGLPAGMWVDRVRRRPIMIGTDIGRAVLLASVPLAAAVGRLGMPQLYVVSIG